MTERAAGASCGPAPASPVARGVCLGVLVAGLASSQATVAAGLPPSPLTAALVVTADLAGRRRGAADFAGEPASADVRRVADWVVGSGDNNGLPFLIVDKVGARVFAFGRDGSLRGATAALLGLGSGDDSPPGIGTRALSTITPAERITPAGRFFATLGRNLGANDILWVDYEAALSLHRVIPGKPVERRLERLATASALDNRISYGCINVPVAFYDGVVRPIFSANGGIVYILPETRSLHAVFALGR